MYMCMCMYMYIDLTKFYMPQSCKIIFCNYGNTWVASYHLCVRVQREGFHCIQRFYFRLGIGIVGFHCMQWNGGFIEVSSFIFGCWMEGFTNEMRISLCMQLNRDHTGFSAWGGGENNFLYGVGLLPPHMLSSFQIGYCAVTITPNGHAARKCDIIRMYSVLLFSNQNMKSHDRAGIQIYMFVGRVSNVVFSTLVQP